MAEEEVGCAVEGEAGDEVLDVDREASTRTLAEETHGLVCMSSERLKMGDAVL